LGHSSEKEKNGPSEETVEGGKGGVKIGWFLREIKASFWRKSYVPLDVLDC